MRGRSGTACTASSGMPDPWWAATLPPPSSPPGPLGCQSACLRIAALVAKSLLLLTCGPTAPEQGCWQLGCGRVALLVYCMGCC